MVQIKSSSMEAINIRRAWSCAFTTFTSACSDTAKIVARVLTSRAVQRILTQLQETDLFVAHWLAEYCNSHPPMTGDKVTPSLLLSRPIATLRWSSVWPDDKQRHLSDQFARLPV